MQSVTLVTPYAGVWIEIIDSNDDNFFSVVTPYAGVWIEIFQQKQARSWEYVTPYAGVWIEIGCFVGDRNSSASHSLRGSVDWNELIGISWL